MKFGNVHCFQAIFSMVQAIKNITSFYKNHLNGYHFFRSQRVDSEYISIFPIRPFAR